MDKKKKALYVSVALVLTLLAGWKIDVSGGYAASLIAAAIMYFGLYWLLEFEVVGLRIVFVFLAPVLFTYLCVREVFLLNTFINSIGNGILPMMVIGIGFGLLTYFFLLTANILNVGSIKKIPLMQVAQTALYFYTVVIWFLFSSTTLFVGAHFLIELLICFISVFVLVFQLLWFVIEDKRQLLYECFSISAGMTGGLLLLIGLPIPPLLAYISLTSFFYIFSGLSMHTEKRSLNLSTMIEYALVALALIVAICYYSDYGLYGRLMF